MLNSDQRVVAWFSCGAASAVSSKLAVEKYPDCNVVYCDTLATEHVDNARFFKRVERWIGKRITVIKSTKYADIDDVFERERYMSGIAGARCTVEMKKVPRFAFQRPDDLHIFGYTADEPKRMKDFRANNPELNVEWILREKFIRKVDCYRILREAGIALPEMYALGFEHNNCFSGETEFITSTGVRAFKEAVGKTVLVRGKGAKWTSATIRSFGSQPLLKLTIRRNTLIRIIYATAAHRWFIQKTLKERTTTELKSGDKLQSMFGRVNPNVRPSSFGVAQGIVFGDGSRGNTLNTAATLVLCGEKNKELLKYFPLSPFAEIATGIEVRDLPRHWKDVPPINECQSFLYGWLAGYFAADGHCTPGGSCYISSASRSHVEYARDVAVRLGIGVNSIGESKRMGYGVTPSSIYSLSLIKDTLREDFFLIAAHRANFNAVPSRRPHPWIVESVEPTNRVEEVFCAVVPEGNAFTLEGNVFTGNCLGCVKASSPTYWQRTAKHFPETFARRAAQSREIGARLVRVDGVRMFLDEMDLHRDFNEPDGDIECGPYCITQDQHSS